MSRGGTPYMFSYCKIKKFLESNAHIDTVLLCAYSSMLLTDFVISEDAIFDNANMLDKLAKELTLLDENMLQFFWARYPRMFMQAVLHAGNHPKLLVRRLFNGEVSYKDLDIGEFQDDVRYRLAFDLAQPRKGEARKLVVAKYQEEALRRIAALCKAKNVTLILITPPTYKPKIYDTGAAQFKAYISANFSSLPYLDYNAFPLPDSAYGDIGHLNPYGARIFSTYLRNNLR